MLQGNAYSHLESQVPSSHLSSNPFESQRGVWYPQSSQRDMKLHRNATWLPSRSYSESPGARSHHSTSPRSYSRHHSPHNDISYRETNYGSNEWLCVSIVKRELDEILSKKDSDIKGVRLQLEQLSHEYPACHVVWVEWSRLELEQGNMKDCRRVLLQGLQCVPGNETLLEKRVKIEERLRNCDGVLECAIQFMATNGTRCVKSIVEAAIVIAKLGYGYRASKLFDSLLQRTMLTQGSVTLDYIRFVFKTEDYRKGLSLLKKTLTKLTKHGPIWFFTFSVLEQDHTVYWRREDIASRPRNLDLTYHLEQALRCLPPELQWKVYYIASQAQLRSFTHIRLWTRMKKRYLQEYCMTYPGVVRVCFDYLKECVLLCPEDYQWKVWLLAGRVLALAGQRASAIKV